MIKVNKINQNYTYDEKTQELLNPWTFLVELSCTNTETMMENYKKNKEMINEQLNIMGQLCVKTESYSILAPNYYYPVVGTNILKIKYTMTKFRSNCDKDILSDTHKWICSGNESTNMKLMGFKNECDLRRQQEIMLYNIIKKKKIHDDMIKQNLKRFGIHTGILMYVNSVKRFDKKMLIKTTTKEKKLQELIKISYNINNLQQNFNTMFFISKIIKKLRIIRNSHERAKKRWAMVKRTILKPRFTKVTQNDDYVSTTVIVGCNVKRAKFITQKIDKAKKNGELKDGDVVVIKQNSTSVKYFKNGSEVHLTKYKNYKNPKKTYKTSSGQISSIYEINLDAICYVSKLTSVFPKAKHPLDINKKSKFCESILKSCNLIYKLRNQVRIPTDLLWDACWRVRSTITFVKDVLFNFR